MTLLSTLYDLYSLETLDTRLTTSKAAIDESTRSVDKEPRSGSERAQGSNPSKWRTPEYIAYITVVAIAVPLMYKSVLDVSLTSSSHYSEYKHLLSDGWLFGRKVDNSDGQYAGFRENVPYLALLILAHPLARKVYEWLALPADRSQTSAKDGPSPVSGQSRLSARVKFDFVSALLFVTALHGFSILKILCILAVNYKIGTALPRQAVPAATWMFNIAILFANEFSGGYSFSSVLELSAPFYADARNLGKALDSFGGLIPRWEVFFKITVLRLISFNLDAYWSLGGDGASSALEKKQIDPTNLSERERVTISAPRWAYTSFSTYVAYTLYPPLYLAGPILSFNDYISQSTYQVASISTRRTIFYGIRFLVTLFCMEFLLHTVYVVAISKSNPDWLSYTPFQLSMLAYFNLHIIWLKLLIPWRFFRLWSLVDGIDPPENMVRCMSDNYSTLEFWRSWHRSYNRWIVRYVHVPLGGAGSRAGVFRGVFNMLIVFTFVALWHDINLQLLTWSWLVVVFVVPEILAKLAFPKSRWENSPDTYRVISGMGAVWNILVMMIANLVGFALGVDGLKGLLSGILGSWQGTAFFAVACFVLYNGVQIMFEHREGEMRRGIKLKF